MKEQRRKHGYYILIYEDIYDDGELRIYISIGYYGQYWKIRPDRYWNIRNKKKTGWYILGDGNEYSTKEIKKLFKIGPCIEITNKMRLLCGDINTDENGNVNFTHETLNKEEKI